MEEKSLLFVYNANGGMLNSILDFAHKNLSPNTYSCNLCALTYGNIGQNKEWKNFLESLSFKNEFLHKDEFEKQHVEYKNTDLPAIFYKTNSEIDLLVTAELINKQKHIRELIDLVSSKIM